MTKTIHLFVPCLVEQFYPQTAAATQKILQYLGYQVFIPPKQTCCGQPAYNSGYTPESTELAEKWLQRFSDAEIIVAPSGSCISMVRNHYGQLSLAPKYRALFEKIAPISYELTEFIGKFHGESKFPGRFDATVTYHASCHLHREIAVGDIPIQLLKTKEGVRYLPMRDADRCCGFGGTFVLKFAELSSAMTHFKAEAIIESEAEYVCGADAGCLYTIQSTLQKMKKPVKTIHIAEILASGLPR
jgi:L-lactate dehydrogenase complex protein LldE